MTRYVGVDPSTKTGLVILNAQGEVENSSEVTTTLKDDPVRFMDIANRVVSQLLETDIITIEGFSYGSKGQGVSTQYGIGWLIRAELIRNRYSYTEVSPSAVKKFATGKGNEKKENMVLPIYKHWGFEHPSDNVRDAYVLAQIARGMNGISKLTKYQTDVIKKIQEGK
jgi:crossover junction endodeoxyribonuclease RuvC